MSLDGLRAWIGEVERKLGMRTRVFLVLAVIAIGGAGAAIYLAVDTRENAVSESDVQALQEKLEAQIAAGAAATGAAEPAPEVEAETTVPHGGPAKPGGGGTGGAGAGGGSGAGAKQSPEPEAAQPETGGGSGQSNGSGGGSAQGGGGGGKPSLAERLEEAEKANENAERKIEGK